MWDVASVSFYVKLPLVPPQGLSLASECFLQTHYSSTFILNRQSRLGFNEGGNTLSPNQNSVRKRVVLGIGVGLSHTSHPKQGCCYPTLFGRSWGKVSFSTNLRWTQWEAGEILGHGTSQNQENYTGIFQTWSHNKQKMHSTHIYEKKKLYRIFSGLRKILLWNTLPT